MFLYGYSEQILLGSLLTLKLSFSTLLFGLIIGIIIGYAKLSPIWFVRNLAEIYTYVIRGVPELLIIFLLFFGGSALIQELINFVSGNKVYYEINAFTAGVMALSLVFGAYASEVIRGALLSIPKGQIEAGLSLGLSKFTIFWHITLPQIWRLSLPGIGNLWLNLLKDTSLVGIVGLDELLRKSHIAANATRDPFTFYMAAAIIYLGFTFVSMVTLSQLEKRSKRGFAH